MVSSTSALAIVLFSRCAGASPSGVFANIASCKCLTNSNGELKTTDCTTDLDNLITPAGDQDFFTVDGLDYQLQTGLLSTGLPNDLCVVAAGGAVGDRAEIKDCSDSDQGMIIHRNVSKLLHPSGLELKMSEDDTLVLAEADDADDHLFEFHCSACAQDQDQWLCTSSAPAPAPDPEPAPSPAPAPMPEPAPAPVPDPEPAPSPAPAPMPEPAPAPVPDPEPAPSPAPAPMPEPTPTGNTTTFAPAPDPTTPVPSAGVQIQSTVSSLCVDLPGGDTSNGALLWQWDCYGGETQQWSFQDGQLVYLPDPSKCMDLFGGDTTNGNRLGLWDCYQGDSQLWGFDSEWGTIYLASSTASDATKCVQIGGENKTDPLVIWDCTAEPQQVWAVSDPITVAVV